MPVIVDDEELQKIKASEDRNVCSKLSLNWSISCEAVKLNFSNYREFLLELIYIISFFIYLFLFSSNWVCFHKTLSGGMYTDKFLVKGYYTYQSRPYLLRYQAFPGLSFC